MHEVGRVVIDLITPSCSPDRLTNERANFIQGRVGAGEVHPPLRELLPRGQRRRLRLRRQQAAELPEPEKVDQAGEGSRQG